MMKTAQPQYRVSVAGGGGLGRVRAITTSKPNDRGRSASLIATEALDP
jgi:hypothetical protein